jgi:hypothetical protein
VSSQTLKGAAFDCPLSTNLATSEESIGKHPTDPARADLQILSRFDNTHNIHDITIPITE